MITVDTMPFPKNQLFVHSVNLSIKKRVLLFTENWNLKVEAFCLYRLGRIYRFLHKNINMNYNQESQ